MTTLSRKLTAQLQTLTETALQKALAKYPSPAAATLADIEQVAREVGQTLEHALAATLAEESAAQKSVTPTCSGCKKK
jgi:hypothetical protein